MLAGGDVILALKVAVVALTALFLSSFVPLARGNSRLHGRINLVFFSLTIGALLTLEVLVRIVQPDLFDYFTDSMRRRLALHLWFALPSALLLPVMLYTGLTHQRRAHLLLAACFAVLWTCTVVTGVFFLPHTVAP